MHSICSRIVYHHGATQLSLLKYKTIMFTYQPHQT